MDEIEVVLDCIDISLHHLSKHSSDGESSTRLARWMHKAAILLTTLKIRNKLATEIKTLKSRVRNVSDRRLRYKLDPTDPNPRQPAAEVYHTAPRGIDVTQLFGEASDKIVNFLNDSDARLRVMTIVGSAGLGKTTLAHSVLNSPNVEGFERNAIVSVSWTYNPEALLKDIVKQLIDQSSTWQVDPSFENMNPVEKCRYHLRNKRYLVILDDVWRPSAWDHLSETFPDDGNKSRIIITTRSYEVARHCSSSDHDVHEMEPLSDKDSKKLLFKIVFGSEQIPSTYNADQICNLEPDILKKCGGLPLAIVSIGGMLAQRKVENWKTVIDRLPSQFEKGNNLDAMRRIISLSYNDMPYHLKACFLYLSVFPEDYDIRRGPLIRRWEAEGFINEVHGLSLEEIAKDYFDGFVSRSVVTHEQLSSNGEFRSFRVHDIMLAIITIKSIQENLVSILGNPKYNTGGHDKIRRLSIHPSSKEEDRGFSKGGSISHVRSLTIMGRTEKPRVIISFSKLKLLKVLDLEGCLWSLNDKDWEEICKLSLLRYLSLRRTATEQLPSKLGKLKGLVTLDVRQTKVKDFPKSITQLQNLQHLLAGEYVHYTRTHTVKHLEYRNQEVVKIPFGLSKMKALKRISFVDVKGRLQALHEVAKLSQLTRLCVIQTNSEVQDWESFGDSLSELSNSLRYLSVMQDQGDNELAGQQLNFLLDNVRSPPILLHSLHLLGRIGSLPCWVGGLHSLASLSLRHTGIANFDVLEKLPSLVSLKLYNEAFTGNSIGIKKGTFPVLKQLVIDNLPNLVELIFEEDGPKNLERLTLYLPETGDTPVKTVKGIDNLEMLQTVELFGTNHHNVVEDVKNQTRRNPNKPIVTFTNQDLRPFSTTN